MQVAATSQNLAALAPAAGLTPTAFDPAKTAASITLSGGNRTITGTNFGSFNWQYAVTAAALSAGRFYSEFTFTTIVQGSVYGAAVDPFVPGPLGVGVPGVLGGVGSIGFFNITGDVIINGAIPVTLAIPGAGGFVAMALDLSSDLVWFAVNAGGLWNGSGAADPATGVGGFALPAAMTGAALVALVGSAASSDVGTGNFGQAAFGRAVPAGFAPGFG